MSSPAPLIFLHGWCCDTWHFAPQLEYFSPHRPVEAIPWRARVEQESGTVNLEMAAGIVEEACGARPWVRPVLIGHSMGGIVAAMIAAARRMPLSAIVIVDATWPLRADQVSPYQDLLPPLMERFAETVSDLFSTRFVSDHDDPQITRQVAEAAARVDGETAVKLLADLATPGRLPGAGDITVPLMGISSSLQLLDWDRVHQERPRAWYGQIVGSGHFLTLQAPGQFNEMLRRFLVSVDRKELDGPP